MTDKKNGYGRVYKSVLLSPSLSCAQKGLYAYLSSFADQNGVAFPHQKKICLDLSISEDSLRKYLKKLQQENVLLIRKHASGNFYHLFPQKGGWGKVYKWVLTDPSIALTSKGLYAVLASFAGSDGQAHPHRGTLLKALQISKDSFYKYLQILKEKKVISVEARKENARFTSSAFSLLPPEKKGDKKEHLAMKKEMGTHQNGCIKKEEVHPPNRCKEDANHQENSIGKEEVQSHKNPKEAPLTDSIARHKNTENLPDAVIPLKEWEENPLETSFFPSKTVSESTSPPMLHGSKKKPTCRSFFFTQKLGQEIPVSQKTAVPINKESLKKTPFTIPRETSQRTCLPTDGERNVFSKLRQELKAMEAVEIPGIRPLSQKERRDIEKSLRFLERQTDAKEWSYETLYDWTFERVHCLSAESF